MMKTMWTALRATVVIWVVCGLLYPLAATGLGQILLPDEANGSLLRGPDGTVVGSRLIGQRWDGPRWFHGRPSALTKPDPADPTKTVPSPYDASNSGGSNLGPMSDELRERLESGHRALLASQPELAGETLPSDMLTASGSGLDPHISPANALLQVPRVARARGVTAETIRALVDRHANTRTLGMIGEPRVNVLELNLALERLTVGQPSDRGSPPAHR
jgi:K+-transporting ATPase ATPase C chain